MSTTSCPGLMPNDFESNKSVTSAKSAKTIIDLNRKFKIENIEEFAVKYTLIIYSKLKSHLEKRFIFLITFAYLLNFNILQFQLANHFLLLLIDIHQTDLKKRKFDTKITRKSLSTVYKEMISFKEGTYLLNIFVILYIVYCTLHYIDSQILMLYFLSRVMSFHCKLTREFEDVNFFEEVVMPLKHILQHVPKMKREED